jgi:hypothetical protein
MVFCFPVFEWSASLDYNIGKKNIFIFFFYKTVRLVGTILKPEKNVRFLKVYSHLITGS